MTNIDDQGGWCPHQLTFASCHRRTDYQTAQSPPARLAFLNAICIDPLAHLDTFSCFSRTSQALSGSEFSFTRYILASIELRGGLRNLRFAHLETC